MYVPSKEGFEDGLRRAYLSGLLKARRERIAAQLLAGMLARQCQQPIGYSVALAVDATDQLIRELDSPVDVAHSA